MFLSYVKSNEQTELTSNIEKDPYLAGWQLWVGRGELGGGEIKQNKEIRLRDRDESVVTVEGRGWVQVEEDKRKINGNGKNSI